MNQQLKKGFSLVEVMILFTILATVLAASVPLITKKSAPLPNKISHGVYRCFPAANDMFSEEYYTGTRPLAGYPKTVTACTFKVPKASLFRVDLYSAGAGGTEAAYIDVQRDDNRSVTFGSDGKYSVVSFYNNAGEHIGGSASEDDIVHKLTPTEILQEMKDEKIRRVFYSGDAGKGGDVTLSYPSLLKVECNGLTDALESLNQEKEKLGEEYNAANGKMQTAKEGYTKAADDARTAKEEAQENKEKYEAVKDAMSLLTSFKRAYDDYTFSFSYTTNYQTMKDVAENDKFKTGSTSSGIAATFENFESEFNNVLKRERAEAAVDSAVAKANANSANYDYVAARTAYVTSAVNRAKSAAEIKAKKDNPNISAADLKAIVDAAAKEAEETAVKEAEEKIPTEKPAVDFLVVDTSLNSNCRKNYNTSLYPDVESLITCQAKTYTITQDKRAYALHSSKFSEYAALGLTDTYNQVNMMYTNKYLPDYKILNELYKPYSSYDAKINYYAGIESTQSKLAQNEQMKQDNLYKKYFNTNTNDGDLGLIPDVNDNINDMKNNKIQQGMHVGQDYHNYTGEGAVLGMFGRHDDYEYYKDLSNDKKGNEKLYNDKSDLGQVGFDHDHKLKIEKINEDGVQREYRYKSNVDYAIQLFCSWRYGRDNYSDAGYQVEHSIELSEGGSGGKGGYVILEYPLSFIKPANVDYQDWDPSVFLTNLNNPASNEAIYPVRCKSVSKFGGGLNCDMENPQPMFTFSNQKMTSPEAPPAAETTTYQWGSHSFKGARNDAINYRISGVKGYDQGANYEYPFLAWSVPQYVNNIPMPQYRNNVALITSPAKGGLGGNVLIEGYDPDTRNYDRDDTLRQKYKKSTTKLGKVIFHWNFGYRIYADYSSHTDKEDSYDRRNPDTYKDKDIFKKSGVTYKDGADTVFSSPWDVTVTQDQETGTYKAKVFNMNPEISSATNPVYKDVQIKVESHLWSKRYRVGSAGEQGKSQSYLASNLGTICRIDVPKGGETYKLYDSVKTLDELQEALKIHMVCRDGQNDDDPVIFEKILEGGKYHPELITSDTIFKWRRNLESFYISPQEANNKLWRPTSIWAKVFKLMGGYDSYDLNKKEVGKGGDGTTLKDKCVAPKGYYQRNKQYLVAYFTAGSRWSPWVIKTEVTNAQNHSAPTTYSGKMPEDQFDCYGNPEEDQRYVNDIEVHKGDKYYDMSAKSGGPGAVVITW